MDPLYEQRLREEVIYLHSLWHQGPPRPTATATRHHLQPFQAIQFKKQKTSKNKNRKNSPTSTVSEPNSSPGVEWPCPEYPSSTANWPPSEPRTNPKPSPLSAEEQSNLSGICAQKKALKAVHEFFASNNGDDYDAVDSSSDDDDDELMELDDRLDEYSFLFKVIKEDTDLREYYEKNFASGQFTCLVCGALGGKKTMKKYKGCLPLVQHSITIANTKSKKSHRAFGQAVCKVLGWDIDRLPDIASMLGNDCTDNKESSFMAVSSHAINLDSINKDVLEGKNDEAASESECKGSLEADVDKDLEDCSVVRTHSEEERSSEALTINSSTISDAVENVENLGTVSRDDVEVPTSQELAIGNGSIDNKEISTIVLDNNTVEGKNEEAAPECECIGSVIASHGDEDKISLAFPDAGKNLKYCDGMHIHNVEEPTSDVAIKSSMFPDAAGNSENVDIAYPQNVGEPEPLR